MEWQWGWLEAKSVERRRADGRGARAGRQKLRAYLRAAGEDAGAHLITAGLRNGQYYTAIHRDQFARELCGGNLFYIGLFDEASEHLEFWRPARLALSAADASDERAARAALESAVGVAVGVTADGRYTITIKESGVRAAGSAWRRA